MGSGLILLVIVGAWLAFFVQMALRSEATDVAGTVDRFHDAMRVLSRRQAPQRPREGTPPGTRGRVPGPGLDPGPGTPAPVPALRRTSAVAGPALPSSLLGREDVARRRAEAAARRAKVLTGLVVLAVLTLVGAATLSWWLLVPHLLVDLLLVGLAVHLRALALRRAAADQRLAGPAPTWTAQPSERAGSVEVRRPVPVVRRPVQIHVAGVPDRMPPRPHPLPGLVPVVPTAPLFVPTARVEQAAGVAQAAGVEQPVPVRPVRGAQGEAWSPVAVPAPTYLSAPPAPRRVVDPSRPAGAVERRTSAEPEVGLHDVAPVVEEPVDHRWAVND